MVPVWAGARPSCIVYCRPPLSVCRVSGAEGREVNEMQCIVLTEVWLIPLIRIARIWRSLGDSFFLLYIFFIVNTASFSFLSQLWFSWHEEWPVVYSAHWGITRSHDTYCSCLNNLWSLLKNSYLFNRKYGFFLLSLPAIFFLVCALCSAAPNNAPAGWRIRSEAGS